MKINFVNIIAVLAGACMSCGGVMIRHTLMNGLSDFKTSLILSQTIFFLEVLSVVAFLHFKNHNITPVGIINIVAILFLGMFLYFIAMDSNYTFNWYPIFSGVFFGIGIISLYHVMSNMDIVSSTVMTRSAGMVCGLILGAVFLRDFPKSPIQYVGLGIIMTGIVIMTFFPSK